MRKDRLEIESFSSGKPALLHWTEFVSPLKVSFNVFLLTFARYLPLKLKNKVLRAAGVKIGRNSAIALGAMFDIFYPEKIKVGEKTTIGYNSTILAHETTQDEFRTGEVEIGNNVLIGANSTVLPGIKIGDGAKIAAGSVVDRDVKEGKFVGGVPIETIDQDSRKK